MRSVIEKSAESVRITLDNVRDTIRWYVDHPADCDSKAGRAELLRAANDLDTLARGVVPLE